MIKLTQTNGQPFWVKAEAITLISEGVLSYGGKNPIAFTEDEEEVVQKIRDYTIAAGRYKEMGIAPLHISNPSTPRKTPAEEEEEWFKTAISLKENQVSTAIVTDEVVEQATEKKIKRPAKAFEEIEIIIAGNGKYHEFVLGKRLKAVSDAVPTKDPAENYAAIAMGFIIPYNDYIVIEPADGALPAITVDEYVPSSDATTTKKPTTQVKRPAKQGETIEITASSLAHRFPIGTTLTAISDAGADRNVLAKGTFIPYSDYHVLE